MTGFGLAKAQTKHSQIEVSLRSVNGRFLEIRFHLPREYVPFEGELKKVVEKYFDRGTVDVFISRKFKAGTAPYQVMVNQGLGKKYFEAYQALAKALKIPASIHLESIARAPDVIHLDEPQALREQEKKHLLEAMEEACGDADKERQREGLSLRKDLQGLIHQLSAEVEAIGKMREVANENLRARYESKLKSKLSGMEIDQARLSQEVVIQLEKSDINEELTRLQEHISNYSALLKDSQPTGKKLDFYTQELLREVNTIGSKSSLSKLTQIVVQAKTLIERLREQVQNVE